MRNEIILLSCCAVTVLTFAANDDGSQVLATAKAKGLARLESLPLKCREVTTVPGKAASLLPEGRRFELVWNDEFDGTALDDSKWSYRTNFWGRRAHWFAAPEDGCVEVRDGLVRLKIKKLPNGQFVSPQLQTGEVLWDVPQIENPKGFWYVGRQSKPKFVHKYGYYECRCRLQKMPGWWSAFWMQTMMQGCCLDPALAGVEQDIMESFEPGEVIPAAFHMDGYGPNYRGFHIPAERDAADPKDRGRYTLAVDTEGFHTYGLLWDPEGYSVYVDGRFRGRNTKAVSQVPEFVLLTTECKWFRNNRMTGKGVPELEAAAAAGDDFVVDYVRVYDCKGEDPSVTRMRPYPTPSRLMRLNEGPHVIGIVHFTVNTFTDLEWGYGSEDPALFNPTDFDAEQIVKACADGGIGGLVIVAKHHDGFCLWPTKTTEHNISKSPFRDGKGDYVKEMELACRKYGLEFGIYVSPWDRNNAAYATPAYVETYHEQIRELAGGDYGPLFEFWFDGANGGDGYYGGAWEKRKIGKGYYRFDEVYAYLRAQQPGICLFGVGGDLRWPGNESGVVPPESGCTRDDGAFRCYEADFPLRPGWFYHKSQDGYSRSGEFLMKIYLRTVGNAAIMDIGISPDGRGLLTDEDVGCLRRFAEVKKAFFKKEVKSPAEPFNLIELKENVTRGERVDAWRLLLDGKEIAAGKKLGYSRLRVLDAPTCGRDLKLEVEGDAKAEEIAIRLYSVDTELVRKVQSSEEPKRPPTPFERCGVLMSRTRDTLKYMVKHPQTTSALMLTPDTKNLDGTPVLFRFAWSTDGEEWTEDPTERHLDNVAANPIPQRIELKAKANVKYVKLTALRTLKDGAAVTLSRLDLVP